MLINRMNKTLFLSVLLAAVLPVTVLAQATVDQVTQEGEKRADAGAAEQRAHRILSNPSRSLSFLKTAKQASAYRKATFRGTG